MTRWLLALLYVAALALTLGVCGLVAEQMQGRIVEYHAETGCYARRG